MSEVHSEISMKKILYPSHNMILFVHIYSRKRGEFMGWVHLQQFIHSFIQSSLFVKELNLLYLLFAVKR